MLGDLRILDTGDELLLDTERVALQELFNMIRRFSLGYDVGCTSARWSRGCSRCSAPTAAGSGSPALPAAEHAHAAASSTESRSGRSAPTSASTCSARPTIPPR